MRIFFTLFITFVFVNTYNAQTWAETNLTEFNYLAISDVEVHNNTLYGIVFSGFSAEVNTLNSTNDSWTVQNISNVAEIPAYIKSTGNKLYLGANGFGYSMIYYSIDNGANFVPDTMGLPKISSGIAFMFGLGYFQGKMIVNLGSSGYWIKDVDGTTWMEIVSPTGFNGGTDPYAFLNDTIFFYDNAGANKLYVSGDYGVTVTERTTNLPSDFQGNIMSADTITGRLYLVGEKSNGSEYGLYYSDDNGTTWAMVDLSSFIGTNVNGGPQLIKALFSDDNELLICLENDIANTTPDVLYSNNGITQIDYDTNGLVIDPAGTIQGAHIVRYNGNIALGLNVRDVYLLGSGANEVASLENTVDELRVYPNPVLDVLTIDSNYKLDAKCTISVYNVQGQLVLKGRVINKRINVSSLESGVYFLEVLNDQGFSSTFKLIKR